MHLVDHRHNPTKQKKDCNNYITKKYDTAIKEVKQSYNKWKDNQSLSATVKTFIAPTPFDNHASTDIEVDVGDGKKQVRLTTKQFCELAYSHRAGGLMAASVSRAYKIKCIRNNNKRIPYGDYIIVDWLRGQHFNPTSFKLTGKDPTEAEIKTFHDHIMDNGIYYGFEKYYKNKRPTLSELKAKITEAKSADGLKFMSVEGDANQIMPSKDIKWQQYKYTHSNKKVTPTGVSGGRGPFIPLVVRQFVARHKKMLIGIMVLLVIILIVAVAEHFTGWLSYATSWVGGFTNRPNRPGLSLTYSS